MGIKKRGVGRPTILTLTKLSKARKMVSMGYKQRAIAKQLGVSEVYLSIRLKQTVENSPKKD